jgi:myo-inositol 2-dehydrogenase/D-chiro-inositol 1-dehydrogenase
MTVRVGIVGVGIMGADHARKIDGSISGAEVSAVADFDAGRASSVAAELRDASVSADGFALIADDSVDAVIVASHDSTHAELVHAALAANKPVLCEKPLAPTAAECRGIIAAQGDRDLITVGFMRRFDPAYAELERAASVERIGERLVAHCVSRNVQAGPGDSSATITNSAIHELDIMPWLLGSPITEVSWHAGRTSKHSVTTLGARSSARTVLHRSQSRRTSSSTAGFVVPSTTRSTGYRATPRHIDSNYRNGSIRSSRDERRPSPMQRPGSALGSSRTHWWNR